MLQPKLLSVLSAFSIGIIALVGGAGLSKADVIIPGNDVFSPTILSQCGGRVDAQPGVVCGPALTLGAGAIATAGTGNLTFKPTASPFNDSLDQSGIGQGGTLPTPGCTNPTCEIGDTNSVTITGPMIDDLVIGSVQDGESAMVNSMLIGKVT